MRCCLPIWRRRPAWPGVRSSTALHGSSDLALAASAWQIGPLRLAGNPLDWQATQDLGFWSRLNLRGKTSEYLSRTSMAQGTPSYTQVDVGLRYYANKDLLMTAGVYNVLDKQIDYDTYDTVLDGRRYTVGMTYSF